MLFQKIYINTFLYRCENRCVISASSTNSFQHEHLGVNDATFFTTSPNSFKVYQKHLIYESLVQIDKFLDFLQQLGLAHSPHDWFRSWSYSIVFRNATAITILFISLSATLSVFYYLN